MGDYKPRVVLRLATDMGDDFRLEDDPTRTRPTSGAIGKLAIATGCLLQGIEVERRADLRRWYREQEDALTVPGIAEAGWDRRLLYRLFDCWVRLFRKDERDDLDPVRGIIAGLRNDQAVYEERYLKNDSERVNRAFASRLVALYHWATATETLARYMLQGKPGEKYTIERVVEKPGLWELVGCRVALSLFVFLA